MGKRSNLPLNTAIYSLGNIMARGTSFLLIPVYARYLSEADYGILELVTVSLTLLTQLFFSRFDSALLRFYFDTEGDARKRLVATTSLFVVSLSAVVAAAVLLLAPWLSNWLFGRPEEANVLRLASGVLFFSVVGQIPFALWRATHKAALFVSALWAKLTLEIGIKLLLLIHFGAGIEGVLFGTLIAMVAVTTGPFLGLIRRSGLRFSEPVLRELVAFAWPLMLAGIGSFILHSADRFMIRALLPLDDELALGQLGVYSMGYKLGTIINFLLLEPFILVWFPVVFAIKNEAIQGRFIARSMHVFVILFVGVGLLMVALGSRMTDLLLQDKFQGTNDIFPIVVFGHIFWAMYVIMQSVFQVQKKNKSVPIVVGTAASVNVLLNVFFIPAYGIQGAAWSTALSFALLAGLCLRRADQVQSIPYQWFKTCLGIGIALALYAVFKWSQGHFASPPIWLELALPLAYALLVLGTGLLSVKEIRELARIQQHSSPAPSSD